MARYLLCPSLRLLERQIAHKVLPSLLRKKRRLNTLIYKLSCYLRFSSAAKTALLLDNTQLGSSQVHVSSAAGLDELAGSGSDADHGKSDDGDIGQEDKPRSRIVAEYLAQGYTISDNAIQRAIALDKKHGVSTRFTQALAQYDEKFHVSDRAKGLDASYGISEKAATGWRGIASYFEKALGTPTGQKLAAFYTSGDKQVRDIHAEARRLADLKGGKGEGEKGDSSGSGSGGQAEDEKSSEKVGGSDDKGEKAEKHTATGPAAEIAAASDVAPLGEKS